MAEIASGMTPVIITGGIDLSVGSLVVLGAMVTGTLIRDHGGGGAQASTAQAVVKHRNGDEVVANVLIPTALYRQADVAKDPALTK